MDLHRHCWNRKTFESFTQGWPEDYINDGVFFDAITSLTDQYEELRQADHDQILYLLLAAVLTLHLPKPVEEGASAAAPPQ